MTSFGLCWLFVALFWISIASAQHESRRLTSSTRNANSQYGPRDLSRRPSSDSDRQLHSQPKIENIETKCSNTEITITVNFDAPFNGVVYSKGHFSNSKCRFVEANSGSRELSFRVPSDDCGTVHQDISKSISNVIVFQMDEDVQEVWDIARRISCSYSNDPSKHGKTVVFKPLSVSMLDIRHQPIKSDALDCWMAIEKGTFPNTEPITGQIGIGEELSILIYLKDEERQYDVSVKDCWAYESDNFEDPNVSKVQLTDFEGCSRKTKLIGNWSKTYDTLDSGATTIAFTNMTAFKFPDGDSVHLTCNIELCKDICEETCGSNSGGLLPRPTKRPTAIVTRRPVTTIKIPFQPTTSAYAPTTTKKICNSEYEPGCEKQSVIDSEDEILPGGYISTTTRKPVCYPGNNDSRCKTPTTPTPIRTTMRGYDNRPKPTEQEYVPSGNYFDRTTTQSPSCYIGSLDPRCTTNVREQPVCSDGSSDYRCPRPNTPIPTFRLTTTTDKYVRPGSGPYRTTTTTREPYRPTPNREQYTPTPSPTVPNKKCYPGEIRPDCDAVCTTGSTDFRCRQTSSNAPTYKPTTASDEEYIRPGGYETTTKKPVCYPGATDYRCGALTTRAPYTTTTTPREQYRPKPTEEYYRTTTTREPYRPTTTTREPYRPTPTREQYRPTSSPTGTKKQCYPGEIRPDCDPVCTAGSTDFRCRPTSSTSPTYKPTTVEDEEYIRPGGYETTTKKPVCYPGATDYRCGALTTRAPYTPSTTTREPYRPKPTEEYYRPTTTREPYRTTTTTREPYRPTPTREQYRPTPSPTVTKKKCYPGEIRPDCDPVCTAGSTDFRCRPTSNTSPTYKPTTVEDEEYIRPGGYETTTKKPVCYPGATDYRCGALTTRAPYTTSTTTREPYRPKPTEEYYKPTTTREPYRPTTTTREPYRPTPTREQYRPTTSPTVPKKKCYPGEIRPDCDPVCTAGSTDFRCRPTSSTSPAYKPTTVEDEEYIRPGGYETTTKKPVCYPGATDYRCGALTTRAPYTTSTTTREPYRPTTTTREPYRPTPTREQYRPTPSPTGTKKQCYPGEIRPDCDPVCTAGSTDFRCRQTSSNAPTYKPTTASDEEYIRPGGYETTTKKPVCYPGATDYRCGALTTRAPYTTSTTTREPYRPTTTTREPYRPTPTREQYRPTSSPTSSPIGTKKQCYPGEIRPDCDPVCTAGSTDFRCRQTSSNAPTYKPTTASDEEYIRPGGYETTTKKPVCYPGATDYRCGALTTRAPYTTSTTTREPYRTTTTTREPYRPTPTREQYRPTSSPTSSPIATKKQCYPGEIRPDCDPVCTAGSTDFRCRQTSSNAPTYKPTTASDEEYIRPGGYETTTKKPVCYPGATDYRCGALTTRAPYTTSTTTREPYRPKPTEEYYKPTTTREPYRTTTTTREPYRTSTTTREPYRPTPTREQYRPTPSPTVTKKKCYPGEIRPDCDPVCTAGSTDFRCRPTSSTSPAYKPTTVEDEEYIRPGGYETTTKKPVCYPGATDYRCGALTTRAPYTTSTTTREPYRPKPTEANYRPTTTREPYRTTTTTREPYRPTPTREQYRQTPSPTGTKKQCYPGEIRPDCDPVCTAGSTDFRCRTTTPAPIKVTTKEYNKCYEGSSDPECSRPTTPEPLRTTTKGKQIICYPNAIDPRCPAICPSSDFRCRKSNVKINDPNSP